MNFLNVLHRNVLIKNRSIPYPSTSKSRKNFVNLLERVIIATNKWVAEHTFQSSFLHLFYVPQHRKIDYIYDNITHPTFKKESFTNFKTKENYCKLNQCYETSEKAITFTNVHICYFNKIKPT